MKWGNGNSNNTDRYLSFYNNSYRLTFVKSPSQQQSDTSITNLAFLDNNVVICFEDDINVITIRMRDGMVIQKNQIKATIHRIQYAINMVVNQLMKPDALYTLLEGRILFVRNDG
ncbi:MAG: hypothetical protein EOP45_07700 [Sphingobacteriaceae bacterium]|nr:MAG: hypothetical protein EOP45_07700 [Sphingobacteriaceae bacterium]